VIQLGVLLARRDIISKFVLWILTLKIYMQLEKRLFTVLRATCKPCIFNLLAQSAVAITTENILTPTSSAGIMFKGGKLEFPLEFLVPQLSVCPLLQIQPRLWNIEVLNQYQ
jgi:hypothetical protein